MTEVCYLCGQPIPSKESSSDHAVPKQLIKRTQHENCFIKRRHRDDLNVEILALNSDCFPDFSERDLRFFKFIDVRDKDYGDWSSPSFFADKPKNNALKQALFVALAVLAKSAAALLVSRQLKTIPSQWRIVAIPYFEKENTVDFDKLL